MIVTGRRLSEAGNVSTVIYSAKWKNQFFDGSRDYPRLFGEVARRLCFWLTEMHEP